MKWNLLLVISVANPFVAFSQSPIGLTKNVLVAELKSNPALQIEITKTYVVTEQLLYNDFNSPKVETGYYFDKSDICIRMVRYGPNENLQAEIAFYNSLNQNQKFNFSHLGIKYAWQLDENTISYIDPKLSNFYSYAIVMRPFRKEYEKYRMSLK